MEQYSARISELQTRLRELLSKDALTIHAIKENKPPQFNVEGVYVISTPNDREDIIYVGKTKTKRVIGRLLDHRSMDAESDLIGMLREHPGYPQDADDYLVRCMEVTDPLERTFFENFSISVLQPVFNRQ